MLKALLVLVLDAKVVLVQALEAKALLVLLLEAKYYQYYCWVLRQWNFLTVHKTAQYVTLSLTDH